MLLSVDPAVAVALERGVLLGQVHSALAILVPALGERARTSAQFRADGGTGLDPVRQRVFAVLNDTRRG